MKEEEAKTKWCPMVRCSNTGDGADNRVIDKGKVYGTNTPWDCCVASDCMMWRREGQQFEYSIQDERPLGDGWEEDNLFYSTTKKIKRWNRALPHHGYCNLGGKP